MGRGICGGGQKSSLTQGFILWRGKMETPTERLLDELRWYGKTIAGGGPTGGYQLAAKRAEEHWYVVAPASL